MQSLTYVEIDVDKCSLTYGIAPCTASLVSSPPTGTRKCFNSLGTCQDLPNFTDIGVTIRFAFDVNYLPGDIDCIPCIKSVSYSPAILSLGTDLGQRASVTIILRDHPDSDTGSHGDKYPSDRTYNPYGQGTFFGKMRTRRPYLRGRALRLIRGDPSQSIEAMETRHFLIDSFDGPKPDGTYTITAKDILKSADSDRAQAPRLSLGYLDADITDTATTALLAPVGIGDSDGYPTTGYLAIGGNEIVAYNRDIYGGLNAFTAGYWKFDGSDGGTSFADSSGNARDMSAIGNAQRETSEFKYGTASLSLDGTGDAATVADGAHWTPAGDFTLDCWVHPTTVAGIQTIASQVQTLSTLEMRWTMSAGGLIFRLFSGGVAVVTVTATTSPISHLVVANEWNHVAIQRAGNVFSLYCNGILIGRTTDADAYPNAAAPFRIGGGGTAGTSENFIGYIDGFRFQNGEATFPDDFSDALPGEYSADSDQIGIIRGQLNTEAVAHSAEDRAQLVLIYDAEDVALIIQDLLETYAGVDPSYIPIDSWTSETAAYLNRLYSAAIPEPTLVKKLIEELVEQASLVIWWDEVAQVINLQVIRSVPTSQVTYNEDNIVEGSMQSQEQPDKRVSRVWTYFGQINPLKNLDQADNYRSSIETFDEDTETLYGSQAIKRIYSRWIPAFGRTVAERLNNIIVGRFKTPPRKIGFKIFNDGQTTADLGSGALFYSWFSQDDTGAGVSTGIQLTRIQPEADYSDVEAEEMDFDFPADLDDLSVIVGSDTYNFNFRSAFDDLYPTPQSGDIVYCTITTGTIVGSTSNTTPAFEVGIWPAGVTVNVIVEGRVQGRGGRGGRGRDASSEGKPGSAGGTAFYTRHAVTLSGSGEFWGGGGGGGGGDSGGGGGGGQGYNPGAGGDKGVSGADNGDAGTTESPGDGGDGLGGGSGGGDGGAEGAAGSAGAGGGGAGGAAGGAIDGNAFVTGGASISKAGGIT